MRTLLELLSALFLFVAASIALGRMLEGASLFHPDEEHLYSPEDFGLVPEDIYIPAGRIGASIHCWYFDGKGDVTLLYVHGNAGNVSDRLPVIKGYLEHGFNVFIFDYRGYGKSGGRPTKKGIVDDTFNAYEFLVRTKGINPANIVILGQSLGGVPALRLATTRPNRGLILEGAFHSTREMAKNIYPSLPLWVLSSNDFDNGVRLKDLDVPLLVIQGDHDPTVPYRHSSLLFDAAPATPGGRAKEYVTIKGGGHTDLYAVDPDNYYAAIKRLAGIS